MNARRARTRWFLACLPAALALLGGCEAETPSTAARPPAHSVAPEASPAPHDNASPAPHDHGSSAPAAVAPFTPADPRILIAKSMLRASRFDQAETALRVVLRDHPEDAQTMFLLGLAIQKQKRYSDAKVFLDQAHASGKRFPEVDHLYYVRGWCAYHLGDLGQARAAFEEHLRRVPTEPDSVFGLGVIALDEDRLDDAAQLFGRAIAMQADAPQAKRDIAKAHARLADVHVRRDALAEAERSLRTAVGLYPDHYEAWAKLARVLDRMGQPDAAARAREEEQAAMVRVGRLGVGSNQDGALPVPDSGAR